MDTEAECQKALEILGRKRLCDLFPSPGDVRYQTLVGTFADVVLAIQEGGYQGDYFLLVRSAGAWGFLSFGYGSCSGCDELQASASFDELEELRDRLSRQVEWKPNAQALASWLRERDWAAQYSGERINGEEKFLDKALALLYREAAAVTV